MLTKKDGEEPLHQPVLHVVLHHHPVVHYPTPPLALNQTESIHHESVKRRCTSRKKRSKLSKSRKRSKQERDNQRLDPSFEQDRRSYNLPDSMTENVLSNFSKYVKHATLQETVLDENPVPNNVAEVHPKNLIDWLSIVYQSRRKFEKWRRLEI